MGDAQVNRALAVRGEDLLDETWKNVAYPKDPCDCPPRLVVGRLEGRAPQRVEWPEPHLIHAVLEYLEL